MEKTAEAKTCEECKKEAAKYKCPGCSLRSCSLPCVHAHKERTSCSGKRDRTSFVPISSFDDTHLLSDYHLLEEILRHSESARRFRTPFNAGKLELNNGLLILKKQAQRRRINLVFLPRGMTKRVENSSWYYQRCIFWRIRWKFHSMDMELVSASADENKSPAEILEGELRTKKGFKTDGLRKLKMLCKESIDTMRFLLAKDMCRGKQRKYIELDPSEPLCDQLCLLTIVEYPTILIVSPSDDTEFTIVKNHRLNKVEVDPITQKLLDSMVEAEGVPYKEEEIEEGEIVE